MKTLKFIAALLLIGTFIGCDQAPTVTTSPVSNITVSTSGTGGNVTSGSGVTARGVVWGTAPSPTISLPTQTNDGTGLGAYTSAITGLTAGTKYYVRAYATNSKGTGYGNEVSFTTATIPIVTMCNQVWTAKNLDVTTYRDGTPIPEVQNATDWQNLTTGAWCYFNNDPANAIYGKLYNWYAVNNPKGLAPVGWHIPSRDEWITLENCLGGYAIAGAALKEAGTTHWQAPNTGATNSTGFTALPGGWRTDATFANIGSRAYFWSTTPNSDDPTRIWGRALFHDATFLGAGTNIKVFGYSVRCVRD